MHKIGQFVNYKSKIIFRIAWHFLTKIEYSLEVKMWLSVKIL